MQLNDVDNFELLLAELGGVFGKQLDGPAKKRFFETLKDLPFATIEACAREHMKHGRFFPKPRDLRPRADREAAESDDRGRHPPLYSPAWWEERSKVLRRISPSHPGAKALASLDEATFGIDPTPEQLRQAADCYARTWPAPSGYENFPEAFR